MMHEQEHVEEDLVSHQQNLTDLEFLRMENDMLRRENNRLVKLRNPPLTYDTIQGNEKLVTHYTGLTPSTFATLCKFVFSMKFTYEDGWDVQCLSSEDQLLLSLMKLRNDFAFIDI
ncbi:unnamed protein product [Darwinula stevensoni]|uniref:Uncharacterized protein n=1 Tax=Darwinula stevensoni TaxID=69355 RepID=A0A7R9FTP6_9CRUS|nr:unnamed protein product [Darwinula stevensoni]CAG0906556.1 unnamed protein product [Darwinula stevensoni]